MKGMRFRRAPRGHDPEQERLVVTPAEAPPRLTTHPLAITMGALFLSSALITLFGGHLGDLLGEPLASTIVVLFGLGGLMILAGSLWRGDPRLGRALERAGYYLSASVWAAQIVLLIPELGTGVFEQALQGTILMFGCIARAVTLKRVDFGVRVAQKEANRRRDRGVQ